VGVVGAGPRVDGLILKAEKVGGHREPLQIAGVQRVRGDTRKERVDVRPRLPVERLASGLNCDLVRGHRREPTALLL